MGIFDPPLTCKSAGPVTPADWLVSIGLGGFGEIGLSIKPAGFLSVVDFMAGRLRLTVSHVRRSRGAQSYQEPCAMTRTQKTFVWTLSTFLTLLMVLVLILSLIHI